MFLQLLPLQTEMEYFPIFVENGSFLRVRNVQIGYVLPKKWTEKFRSQYVRLTYLLTTCLHSLNTWVMTRYRSSQGTLSGGVDYGFYLKREPLWQELILNFKK